MGYTGKLMQSSLLPTIKTGKPDKGEFPQLQDTCGLQCLGPRIQAQDLPEFGAGASSAAGSQHALRRWGWVEVNLCVNNHSCPQKGI